MANERGWQATVKLLEAEILNLREQAHGWYASYKEMEKRNDKAWEALDMLINCPAMADARALLARREAELEGKHGSSV